MRWTFNEPKAGDMIRVCLGEFYHYGIYVNDDEIILAAKSRIGERGYNILYNNCEHFVYECVFGIKYCSQTEKMRKLWKATVDGRK